MSEPLDRREFLRAAGRVGWLAALAGLGWRVADRDGCRVAGSCPHCPLQADCELPPAVERRDEAGHGGE